MICFAVSSVAENEEYRGRQRPRDERYPKPKPARSSTLASHLGGKRYRSKKNDENENRPHVHLTVSGCHRYHSTEPALRRGISAKSELEGWVEMEMPAPVAKCWHSARFGLRHIQFQILGARSARSKTGVFSISPGPVPEGVSSAACRIASAVASRPSTVSLAALPESCGRAGTCSPVSPVTGSRLFCGILVSLE